MRKPLYFLIAVIYIIQVHSAELEDENAPSKNRDEISCVNGNEGSCKSGGGASAASIAQKAAQEAKAAEDAQQQAGQQAAHQAKESLAEKAIEAERAAEAALGGKSAMVQHLTDEIQNAEYVAQEEKDNLQQLKETITEVIKTEEEAKEEIKLLEKALKLAQANANPPKKFECDAGAAKFKRRVRKRSTKRKSRKRKRGKKTRHMKQSKDS